MKLFGYSRGLIGHAKDVVAEYEPQNPHTGGRVRQVMGGLLITHGFFGLDNPYERRKSRSGIFGQFVQVVFGLVFVGVGLFILSVTSPQGDATTTGTLTEVTTHAGQDGTTCSLTAEFWVDGQRYVAGAPVSSSGFCSKDVGSTIDIRYDSTDPAEADIDEDSLVWLLLIFPVAGLVVAIPSLIGFLFSVAAIIFGWRLVRSGRAMAELYPATSSDEELVSEATDKFFERVALNRRGSTRAVVSMSRPPLDAGSIPTGPQRRT